jgi:hypothetical protein
MIRGISDYPRHGTRAVDDLCLHMAQVGDCVAKTQGLHLCYYCICTYYVHILMQILIVYFSLQVKNKPRDGVANCVFILELGLVTNN